MTTFAGKAAASADKVRGGYYTPAPMARFLARWVCQAGAKILEPSCGDGRILRELAARHEEFAAGGEAAMRETYRALCATLGRQVRVELPDGSVIAGEATDIEEAGRLVVRGPDGEHLLNAGDVVHVR